MPDDSDLPIALRRTRRSINGLSARYASAAMQDQGAAKTPTSKSKSKPKSPARTPSRPRSASKRVRFSDPGLVASATTGLTPMIQRTSLASGRRRGTVSASPSRRRHSAPITRLPHSPSPGSGLYNMDSPAIPFSGSVTFLPLRQVLDGRVKRRLRRNGLSEEMNNIHAERKRQSDAARMELERLRVNVAEKDAEIRRLHHMQQLQTGDEAIDDNTISIHDDDEHTITQDTERIFDLEKQVAELRRELADRTNALEPTTPEAGHRSYNWTMAAHDPFASTISTVHDDTNVHHDDDDDFTSIPSPDLHDDDDADDEFGDTTLADLQCSTPSRAAKHQEDRPVHTVGQGSFPTPPATSPAARPVTPTTPKGLSYHAQDMSTSPMVPMENSPPLSVQPRSVQAAEVQVCLPDAETQLLQDELASLQREVTKLETSLDAQRSFVTQLNTKLSENDDAEDEEMTEDGAEDTEDVTVHRKVNSHVTLLLRRLSDKTAALAELSTGLCGLWFKPRKADEEDEDEDEDEPPKDASEVVIALAAAFRSARLELEYLTPGEIALPLTAAGAAVLDLMLERLRTLGRQVRESEEQLDEYHEMERSLKQQLAARVAAMDGLTREVADRDTRLGEMEKAAEAQQAEAQAAAEAAAKAAAEAEKVATETRQAHEKRVAELETGLDQLKGSLANYARDVAELEAVVQRLEGSLADKDAALATQTAEHNVTVHAMREEHGKALAERDARISELRSELEQAHAALRVADETAQQLRVDNAGLRARLVAGQKRARTAVASLQSELARMVGQLGAGLLGEDEDEVADPEAETMTDGGRQASPGLSSTMTVVPTGLMTESTKRSSLDNIEYGQDQGDMRKRRRFDSGLSFLDEV